MKRRIYLDNNATTQVDPRVFKIVADELQAPPSNPSSAHWFGQEAKKRLICAREQIAGYLKVKPQEILFTSGGTESMNLLIHGLLLHTKKGHLLTSNIEHPCVHKTLESYASQGLDIEELPTGLFGAVQVEQIARAIRPDTNAMVFTAVSSETVVKHDIQAIGELCHRHGIPLIIDGVALLGKEIFEIPPGVMAIGFSGHKIHAPKGVGFAYLRSHLQIAPHHLGGEQEYGKRAGTENLPAILGLAHAVSLLEKTQEEDLRRIGALKEHLESVLCKEIPPVVINGLGPRVANTSNLCFPGVDGEDLLLFLDLAGIAISHGSACSSGSLEPSRVLINMGLQMTLAKSSIRFSLSRYTTKEEIDFCIEKVIEIVNKLRHK
ncbi:MAG: cysteine desulfurase [Chlamydiales bacterium]|nr:cysteine desulfurase [Chlamydiales bacterium]